jgi:PadR family transcriptional regulator PadR
MLANAKFMTSQPDIESIPPLREATLCILLSLAAGPKHGYAVMKDVTSLSHGRVELSTSTLYSAFKRLLDRGWIRRVDDPLPDETARVRKHYELTDIGRRILDAEIARLQALLSVAQLRTSGGQA